MPKAATKPKRKRSPKLGPDSPSTKILAGVLVENPPGPTHAGWENRLPDTYYKLKVGQSVFIQCSDDQVPSIRAALTPVRKTLMKKNPKAAYITSKVNYPKTGIHFYRVK